MWSRLEIPLWRRSNDLEMPCPNVQAAWTQERFSKTNLKASSSRRHLHSQHLGPCGTWTQWLESSRVEDVSEASNLDSVVLCHRKQQARTTFPGKKGWNLYLAVNLCQALLLKLCGAQEMHKRRFPSYPDVKDKLLSFAKCLFRWLSVITYFSLVNVVTYL